MFAIVLKILILIVPIMYVPLMPLNYVDISVFRLCIVLLGLSALYSKPVRHFPLFPLVKWFIILGVFNVITHFFSPLDSGYLINVFLGIFGIGLIYAFVKDPAEYYKYFIISLAITLILYYVQVLGYNPILRFERYDKNYGSFFGTANRYNNYLALLLPFCLINKGKWKYNKILSWILFFVVIGSCLLVNKREIAIFGTGYVVMYFCCSNNMKVALITLTLFLAVYFHKEIKTKLIPQVKTSINTRVKLWDEVLIDYKTRPILNVLTGYGISWPRANKHLKANEDPSIYSDHVQFVLCTGIFGLIFWFMLWGRFFDSFNPIYPASLSLLTVFLLCFVEYPLQIPRLWPYLTIITGFHSINIWGDQNIL